ncbi:AMIN-like domain-containing (lipo)protein [Blastococcus capsensis]|uniref:AMIN-like domain-containing (lipo)protein n=1 Tax=Blastococcus capsensis TaxID=1564163 RepID=UPI0025404568|nr:hypothetical protein [Blastococcus capsensis]MDK3255583.1 hypothetical protein [Blastococcus capsensis]
MRASSRVVPVLVIPLIALSGCAQSSNVDPASAGADGGTSSRPPALSSVEPEPDGAVAGTPFEADTEPDVAQPSADARLTVSDVRVAAQDGYDRVVFELGGDGTPGWDVRYVDQAYVPGSGQAVEVVGGGVLEFRLNGAGYPFETGVDEYPGREPLRAPDTSAVTEVIFQATYEGTTTAFIGTRDRTPFRVSFLENPARVVVDVAPAG